MTDPVIRTFKPEDLEWLVEQHAVSYARDEGFDDSFGVLVREILEAFVRDHDPACERGFMAWQGADRLGSVFCVRLDDETAKLRLFLLTPKARGKGLGQRLLDSCMAFARDCGYRRMVLWTHESHVAACALYKKNGWRVTKSEPAHSFGVDLTELTFEIDLTPAN